MRRRWPRPASNVAANAVTAPVVSGLAALDDPLEVLPRDEFDDEHLPGALSLPLKSLTAGAEGVLDRARPVVVYCWDGL